MSWEFFNSADMLGRVFWLCAIAGTLFFSLRVVMMLVAGDTGDGGDSFDIDGDATFDDSGHLFEVLSVNSITAFIMMFGWSGLTAHLQYQLGAVQSIIIAFITGTLSLLITAWLFSAARNLQDRGAVFNVANVVGLNAQVYQKIPPEGAGKVNVTMAGGSLRELDAISADKVEIPSFQTVKVVSVVDQRTVSVRQI